MNISIVIPVHNEASTIGLTLTSIVNQTRLPNHLVVVNDNSSDESESIISKFVQDHDWITSLSIKSTDEHLPGTKVIHAFYKGLEKISKNFDVICKFDGDIILPTNYLETIEGIFKENPNAGIAGGLLYIEKKGEWVYEPIASKDHVRGPIKAYRKSCFDQIGGLKPAIGWDTIDSLLAQFYGWKVETIKNLRVKHLKPTGTTYSTNTHLLSGERWYNMRYGFVLTCVASFKSAIIGRNLNLFIDSLNGYQNAKKRKLEPQVSFEQGRFIRKLRWKTILKKFY